MTTNEAFENLTKNNLWWVGIVNTAQRAATIKYDYKRHLLSVNKMEELLHKAGYKVVQEKMWVKK